MSKKIDADAEDGIHNFYATYYEDNTHHLLAAAHSSTTYWNRKPQTGHEPACRNMFELAPRCYKVSCPVLTERT
jgi:hypothetical protein